MSNPINFKFGGAKRLVDEVTAQRLNAMLDEIRRTRPLPGRGISVRQESHGVRIDNLGGGGGSGAAASRRQPWDIYVSKKEEDGSFKLRVQPGTLSRILPSNWDAEFSAQEDTFYYGLIQAETDGRFVTSAVIDLATEVPERPEPVKEQVPASVSILFGLFKDGKNYNLSGGGDIGARPVIELVASADPPAEAGQAPWELYYSLR
jgi:hypothetical protein